MPVLFAPFDENGNMISWRPTRPGFSDTSQLRPLESPENVRVVGMYSGRSAKGVYVADEDGHRYPMFVKDLIDVLMANGIVIDGPFEISKRGQNYGIRTVKDG